MGDAMRQYTGPLLLALLVHLAAVSALYANWNPAERERRIIEPPKAVQSTLVMLEPKPKAAAPAPQPVPQPRRQPESKPPEPKPQPREKPEEKPETKPPDADADRREEDTARQERLEALAQTAFQQALQDEARELADAESAEDAEAAQAYRQGIYEAVVANWSRPPSARNYMEAELLVELVPTGQLVNVTLVKSSGNDAFDRSAESAVRKAAPFEVPEDPDVFEDYFRRFNLLFRPEDLLR